MCKFDCSLSLSLSLPPLADSIEQRISSLGHSNQSSHEPNLNDVVDFLGHSEPSMVANAAAYLQHLAYGDDNMKAKIR